jgi:hypothetical protein
MRIMRMKGSYDMTPPPLMQQKNPAKGRRKFKFFTQKCYTGNGSWNSESRDNTRMKRKMFLPSASHETT